MNVEEFILVPLNLWNQQIKRLDISKPADVSLPTKNISSNDNLVPEFSFDDIKSLTKGAFVDEKEKIVEIIRDNPRVSLSLDNTILLDNNETNVNIGKFLDILYHRNKNKKYDPLPEDYYSILSVLNIPQSLIKNTNAFKTTTGSWNHFRR